MSRLATPVVGILGCRAGMPGWMVGGPGASVTRARSSFVVLASMHGEYQLMVQRWPEEDWVPWGRECEMSICRDGGTVRTGAAR